MLMAKVSEGLREVERTGGIPQTGIGSIPVYASGVSTDDSLRQLSLNWNIDANAVVHSTRPRLGAVIIKFQQIVRRFTWWFTVPILDQIISFNSGVVRSLGAIQADMQRMESRIDVLLDSQLAAAGPSGQADGDPNLAEDAAGNLRPSPSVRPSVSSPGDDARLRAIEARLATLSNRLDALDRQGPVEPTTGATP
jgi:hypothetical protein